jgi:hypothetical protein
VILTPQCFILFYIYLLRVIVLVRCKFIITHKFTNQCQYFIRIGSTSQPTNDESMIEPADSAAVNKFVSRPVGRPKTNSGDKANGGPGSKPETLVP